MKAKFSAAWKSSKKPAKQIKYRANAPLHIKQKMMSSHLSGELRKKYSKRSIVLRKGDSVKVMRGSFRKHHGKVESVEPQRMRVFVSGVERSKKDGTKALLPLHPSNLIITELSLDDKLRQKILEKGYGKTTSG